MKGTEQPYIQNMSVSEPEVLVRRQLVVETQHPHWSLKHTCRCHSQLKLNRHCLYYIYVAEGRGKKQRIVQRDIGYLCPVCGVETIIGWDGLTAIDQQIILDLALPDSETFKKKRDQQRRTEQWAECLYSKLQPLLEAIHTEQQAIRVILENTEDHTQKDETTTQPPTVVKKKKRKVEKPNGGWTIF